MKCLGSPRRSQEVIKSASYEVPREFLGGPGRS